MWKREGVLWPVGISIVVVICGIASWQCWDKFTDHRESLSTTIRNIALVIGGGAAILLAVWRSRVAERQAATSQQGLLNERYQKGAEMLGSSVLAVRLGGIYELQGLAKQYPGQYHVQTMRLLCAFIRHPTKDANIPEQPEDAKTFTLREDVQVAIKVIGGRSENQLGLEAKGDYYIDLHSTDLRGGNLRGLNLSALGRDVPITMSMNTAFSNPLMRTDLSAAKLQGADFFLTQISGVDFSRNGKSPASGLTTFQLWVAQWDDANSPVLKGLVDPETGRNLEDDYAEVRTHREHSESL